MPETFAFSRRQRRTTGESAVSPLGSTKSPLRLRAHVGLEDEPLCPILLERRQTEARRNARRETQGQRLEGRSRATREKRHDEEPDRTRLGVMRCLRRPRLPPKASGKRQRENSHDDPRNGERTRCEGDARGIQADHDAGQRDRAQDESGYAGLRNPPPRTTSRRPSRSSTRRRAYGSRTSTL